MTADITTLCNGVIPFIWDRLQLGGGREVKIPSLREDWFVEDALAAGCPFVWRGRDPETSLRLLFRYARDSQFERDTYHPFAAELLLHQMTQLMPVLVAKAAEGRIDQ